MKKLRLPFYERMFFAFYAFNHAIKADKFTSLGGNNWFFSVNMLTFTIVANIAVLARYIEPPIVTSSHGKDLFLVGAAICGFNWAFFFNRKRFIAMARNHKSRTRISNISWMIAMLICFVGSAYLLRVSSR